MLEQRKSPMPTAAMMLEIAGMRVFREQFGMNTCRERGVGPRRKMLGPHTEIPTGDLFDHNPALQGVNILNDARQVLADLCRECPYQACKMKIWDINQP